VWLVRRIQEDRWSGINKLRRETMKRIGNNIVRITAIAALVIAWSIPVAAMQSDNSRVMRILEKLEELSKADADIADLLEKQIRSGDLSGEMAATGSEVASATRAGIKALKGIIATVRKRPDVFEDTDHWIELRSSLIKLTSTQGESIKIDVGHDWETWQRRSRQIKLDLIELMNPNSQN